MDNKPPSTHTLSLTLRACLLILGCAAFACQEKKVKPARRKVDYIRAIEGKNDTIPPRVAQAGEVLIAYADCYTCHKKEERLIGPAFTDVAKRYPVQQGYISLLAQKVILGGTGAWGNAVMTAHPHLSAQDAETMVSYILSLKQQR